MPNPRGQRDYKAEYARRTARAKQEGYKGYSQKRIVNEYVQRITDRFMARIDMSDFDFSQLDSDDPEYWIWFRVNYGQGTGTA